jgi:hypothetical protein
VHATLLQGTAALNCAAGIIGGAAGKARDTELIGIDIAKNATAAVLTIAGLADSSGAAASWMINGLTSADMEVLVPYPLLNEFGAFTFTPSVAGVIWVFTRPYIGP